MIVSFVTPRIAVGGKVDSYDPDVLKLAAKQIAHVLDLQEFAGEAQWFEDALAKASRLRKAYGGAGIKYLWNPAIDDGLPKPAEWFKASWDFIRPALADGHSKVYVHCRNGFNRGPSTVYFALRAYGSTPLKARLSLWWHRPITFPFGIRYAPDAEKALKELGLAH